jgi:hypothetical protein
MKVMRNRLLEAILVGGTLLAATPDALAHAHPKVMVPAADSSGPSPATISITFSEAVEPKFSSLNVTDEEGKKKFNTAASTLSPGDPKTLTLALPPLSPGPYKVHWVSVATDGHRMEGEYQFTVK